jgi:hypothetical protein
MVTRGKSTLKERNERAGRLVSKEQAVISRLTRSGDYSKEMDSSCVSFSVQALRQLTEVSKPSNQSVIRESIVHMLFQNQTLKSKQIRLLSMLKL